MRIQPFFCLIIISLLAFSSLTWADSFNGPTDLTGNTYLELTINGPTKLTQVKTSSLTVNGPVEFDKINVAQIGSVAGPMDGEKGKFADLTIKGAANLKKVIIKNLNVTGPLSLTHFTIKGHTTILGPLSANDGGFKDITISSSDIKLRNVKVRNITVLAQDTPETIQLIGNTIVIGNITFESGQGTVKSRSDNVQVQGKVTGGKLIEL